MEKIKKDLYQSSSHSPITILSPVAKVLDSLILLKEILPLADHQHVFRGGQTTATALCEVTIAIAESLNSKYPHH